MKRLSLLLTVCIVSLLSSFSNPETLSNVEFCGIWLGKMKVTEAMELRIAYVIKENPDKTLSATMNVIEQKAFDIPMDTVIIDNGLLKIEFQAAGITYSGKYNPDDGKVDGSYQQGDASFKLILSKVDKLPGKVVRTQIPKGPFPYSIEEIVFKNIEADVELSGTLTIPQKGNAHPAIILLHGSGRTDRNETEMGHFQLLADYFSRNGFVVLRYDKRGVDSSTGNYDEATTFDFAEDAKAGVEYLRRRDEVDPGQIGIIGHSEGSLIAPMLASEDHELAFIILMGCMGVNGGEIRVQQTEKIAALSGVPDEQVQKDIDQIKAYHSILCKEMSDDSKVKTIKEMYPDIADGMIQYLLKPWYQNFIQIEPSEYLEKVSCPVLALSGEKDVQCCPEDNLPQIEQALENGGNTDFLVKSIPGLNHLFQTCGSGLPIEYENIAEIIAPYALDLMLEWIHDIQPGA